MRELVAVDFGDFAGIEPGKVATGTWHKPDNLTPTTYRDVQGNEMALTPGKTWIALPYGPGSSFR